MLDHQMKRARCVYKRVYICEQFFREKIPSLSDCYECVGVYECVVVYECMECKEERRNPETHLTYTHSYTHPRWLSW